MPPVATSAIDAIATLVSAAPRQHVPLALARSRDAFVDTVACMFAGATSAVAEHAAKAVGQWSVGQAVLVGQEARLNPPFAAMVNGAAAHALDFDDFDEPANAHPSAVIFPALLALASERSVSGVELLDAHIVGVEVMQRLGEAMNLEHYLRGWLSTLTLGTLGAAAACARLARFDHATTVATLSLGASMASGLTNQGGYLAKQLHPGLAAKNGIMASALAGAGITGSEHTIDGTISLARSMGTYNAGKFNTAMAKLGTPWSILEYGLITKAYPTCGYAHRVIDAAIALHAHLGTGTQKISALEISVPDYYLDLLVYNTPTTAAQAMFSAPYNVATALVTGRFGLDALTARGLEHPEVIRLCDLAHVTTRTPKDPGLVYDPDDPDTVAVTFDDGHHLMEAAKLMTGSAAQPMSAAAMRRKFDDCVSRCPGLHDHGALWSMLLAVSNVEDVGRLVDRLAAVKE